MTKTPESSVVNLRRRIPGMAMTLLMVLTLISLPQEAQAADRTLYVAPWGEDTVGDTWEPAPNSFDTPWKTIQWAVLHAEPGDTILVRGGTYVEEVGWDDEPYAATKDSPILLTNYENERVVLKGHITLKNADYWTVDGINVTRDPATNPHGENRLESLVKFSGGVGWQLLNSEIWGTIGVSNVMITGQSGIPRDFRIAGNCIYDNLATEDKFMQDHNIYLQPGYDSGPGVIERNILFNAPNGANIKAAGGDPAKTGAANILISHNTMSTAGAGVIVGYDSHGISMTGNLIGPPEGGGDLYVAAILGNTVTGTDNVARNNAVRNYEKTVWSTDDSTRPISESESIRVSPDFDNITDCDGFHPADEAASAYGRYGDGDYPATGSDSFFDDDDSVFEADIEWIASQDITHGCNPPLNTMFCPDDPVSRGQMAAFLVRALDLTANTHPGFTDVPSGSTFADDIGKLATADITRGCNPPTNDQYCPDDPVSREQMAAFLTRALSLSADDHPGFVDVPADSTFADDIGKLATADITRGCNPPTNDQYCPGEPVLRGQMAAFLTRALQG